MKNLVFLLILSISFISCKKECIEPNPPTEVYTEVVSDNYCQGYAPLLEGTWQGEYMLINSVCLNDTIDYDQDILWNLYAIDSEGLTIGSNIDGEFVVKHYKRE